MLCQYFGHLDFFAKMLEYLGFLQKTRTSGNFCEDREIFGFFENMMGSSSVIS